MGLILSILIGGGAGALLGYYGKCTSGTCPLTANPWRGTLYGVVLGLLFHTALARTGDGSAHAPAGVVKPVDQAQFETAVSEAHGPVVVDFYATWCGPCKRLSPMLEELAAPLTNKITFLKVDVDRWSELARRFRIEGVPTLVFLEQGKETDRIVGLPAKGTLKTRLEKIARID